MKDGHLPGSPKVQPPATMRTGTRGGLQEEGGVGNEGDDMQHHARGIYFTL